VQTMSRPSKAKRSCMMNALLQRNKKGTVAVPIKKVRSVYAYFAALAFLASLRFKLAALFL
jgi:hypothetical protein